jgi:hypothetical protein
MLCMTAFCSASARRGRRGSSIAYDLRRVVGPGLRGQRNSAPITIGLSLGFDHSVRFSVPSILVWIAFHYPVANQPG